MELEAAVADYKEKLKTAVKKGKAIQADRDSKVISPGIFSRPPHRSNLTSSQLPGWCQAAELEETLAAVKVGAAVPALIPPPPTFRLQLLSIVARFPSPVAVPMNPAAAG